MLEAYVDGGCQPNPGGTAAYGIVVFSEPVPDGYTGKDKKIWSRSQIIGKGPEMSNNVAEYAGLIALLEWYKHNWHLGDLKIRSDSQLVVMQMQGKWRIKSGLYTKWAKQAVGKLLEFGLSPKIEFELIPREINLADSLATEALADLGIVRSDRR